MIRQEKDVKRLVYWIRACCVLHNLVLQDPVEQAWLRDEEEDGDEIPTLRGKDAQGENIGKKKRRDLVPIVLSNW